MSKLIELREKRKKLWEKTKAFLESVQNESGIVSAEDTATFEKMEAEVTAMTTAIERMERLEAVEGKLGAVTGSPVLNAPGRGIVPIRMATRSTDDYAREFWNALKSPHPVVTNNLIEGSDPQGGYLVPEEFERTLIQSLEANNIMRGIARIIRTNSDTMKIPVVATKGVASWVDEAADIPTSDGTFGQVILNAYKIGTIVKVSQELLADSAFPLESFLAEDFGRRIGTLEEEAFLVGDGTGKPTGVLTSAQVGKTTASATAVNFDDLMDLYHSLKVPYRNKAVFLANDSTLKALRKLKTSDGQYIWQPSVSIGTPDTILGRSVHVSPFVPEIAAGASVLAFGDFSYYWIGDRAGRTFARLNELYSESDQVGFKATQRVDAKLILPEAVKVLKMAAGTGGA